MKFTPGVYAHKNFRDVDFSVEHAWPTASGYELMGYWVRRDFGCGSLLLGGERDLILIKPEQYPNWQEVA
jgi:hypothetical protein